MNKVSRFILSGIVLTALAAAKPALANSIEAYFSIQFAGSDYTFSLPDTPTVGSHGSDDFSVANVPITITGAIHATETVTVFFTNTTSPGDGGVAVFSGPDTFDFINPPSMFSGPTSAPTFVAGTYNLENQNNTGQKATAIITLSPEPSALVLFATGLLGLLVLVARRRLSARACS